jgi:hypothetical protein
MTATKPDKYDHAITYLTRARKPREIVSAWQTWNFHPAGCLFAPVIPVLEGEDGYPGSQRRPDGLMCGCLTEIRGGGSMAWTDDLTKAIAADNRVPALPHQLRLENLPAFAEWQRKIDRELRDPEMRERDHALAEGLDALDAEDYDVV